MESDNSVDTDAPTAFLRARLDEDEQTARDNVAEVAETRALGRGLSSTLWDEQDASAARLLREVTAHRLIIEPHQMWEPEGFGGRFCSNDGEPWPCPTMRALAAIYADHPDYRQEWA